MSDPYESGSSDFGTRALLYAYGNQLYAQLTLSGSVRHPARRLDIRIVKKMHRT